MAKMPARWAILLVVLGFVWGCAGQHDHWPETQALDTIEAYEEFLRANPDSEWADEARAKIQQLRFKQAQAENTIDAYEEFLGQYPAGEYAAKATAIIENLLYGFIESEQTLAACQRYLSRFPDGHRTAKVRATMEEIEFVNAQLANSTEVYEKFLQRYPDSKYTKEINARLGPLEFRIERFLLVPWAKLSGCHDLEQRTLKNRIKFSRLVGDDGVPVYVLTPLEEQTTIQLAAQDTEEQTGNEIPSTQQSMLEIRLDGRRPDDVFFSALGVGTYLLLASDEWIEICGVTFKSGAINIVEKGLEFQAGTVFADTAID